MDPLRCGAGEVGAFHPSVVLREQYEQLSRVASVRRRADGAVEAIGTDWRVTKVVGVYGCGSPLEVGSWHY